MIQKKHVIDDPFFVPETQQIFLVVLGLVLPALLIFIVQFTGYSEIVEEIAKASVVIFLILNFSTLKSKILAGILFGFLFGLSENCFYFSQIFEIGNIHLFWLRFIWTMPMHILTILFMVLIGSIKKWFVVIGFVGAVLLHGLFNGIVAGM